MADDDDLDDYSYGLGDDDDIEEKPTIILVGLKRFSLFPGVFFHIQVLSFQKLVIFTRSLKKKRWKERRIFGGNYSF